MAGQPSPLSVGKREVVDNASNPHAYDMPAQRRLEVAAHPVDQYVTPAMTDAAKLAEALGSFGKVIEPRLKQNELDKAQAEADAGANARMGAGSQTDNDAALAAQQKSQAFQNGYMGAHGLLAGQEDAAKLKAAYETSGLQGTGVSADAWLQQNWQGMTAGMTNPHYTAAYTKAMAETYHGIRKDQFDSNLKSVQDTTVKMGTQLFQGDIQAAIDKKSPWTVAMMEQRSNDLMQSLHITRQQADQMAFDAASAIGDQGHPEVYEAFKAPKSDGTPGIYFKSGMGAKIETARTHAEAVAIQTIERKQLLDKVNREHARDDKTLAIVQKAINGDAEGAKADFTALSQDPNIKNLFNTQELASMYSTITSVSHKEESDAQKLATTKLLVQVLRGKAGVGDITAALDSHDIGTAGATTLLSQIATQKRDDRRDALYAANQEKAIYKSPDFHSAAIIVKDGLKPRFNFETKLEDQGDALRQGLATANLYEYAGHPDTTPKMLNDFAKETVKNELEFRKGAAKDRNDPYAIPPLKWKTPADLKKARDAGRVSDGEFDYALMVFEAQLKRQSTTK